jgi:hypothetical protein
MAWWFQPLEILKDGNPSGRYRMTRWSDEDGGGPFPLCPCPDGHPSKAEAYACWERQKIAKELMGEPTGEEGW